MNTNSNPTHYIYRNGKLYDSLDPRKYAVKQITSSYAEQWKGDTFTLKNEDNIVYYEVCVQTVK